MLRVERLAPQSRYLSPEFGQFTSVTLQAAVLGCQLVDAVCDVVAFTLQLLNLHGQRFLLLLQLVDLRAQA